MTTTHDNTIVKRVGSLMVGINDLHAQKSALLHELNRSMAIQKMWPGIFKNGIVTSRITGRPLKPDSMKFIVTDGTGQEFEMPLLEVPDILWAHMKPKFRVACARTMGRTPNVWRD
jgi:hypothetical protein